MAIKRERLDATSSRKLFEKGREKTGGRQKGVTNKTTQLIKEALIMASEREGSDGRGKGGLIGHLRALSRKEPAAYMRMLEKLLPMQITGKDGGPMQMVHTSKEQVLERFKERGLPLPPSLMSIPAHGEGEGEKPN